MGENMKIKMKSVVSIAMALCLAMVVLLGSTMEVQAAAYKKTITKTVTIKRGKQAVFMMDFKDDDDSIKVKINVVGKAKGLNLQAVIPEISAGGNITGKKRNYHSLLTQLWRRESIPFTSVIMELRVMSKLK